MNYVYFFISEECVVETMFYCFFYVGIIILGYELEFLEFPFEKLEVEKKMPCVVRDNNDDGGGGGGDGGVDRRP